MTETQDIVFGITGQSLVWDAPEGRPSSVTTSEVFDAHSGDDDTAESALDGSAAVETDPDTTFDAASGASESDPRLCNVAATTGVEVDRAYLATNALGEREWIDVAGFTSGASVRARAPLHNDYASADTFQSTRITHGVDSTWVADSNNLTEPDPNPGYRWRLVYVVDSVTYTRDVYFSLVRYGGDHSVTPVDMERRFPGWLNALPHNHFEDQGRAIIEEGYKLLRVAFHRVGLADESIRNAEIVDHLVTFKAHEHAMYLAFLAGGPLERWEAARSLFSVEWEGLIGTTLKTDVQTDDGGAGSDAPIAMGITVR